MKVLTWILVVFSGVAILGMLVEPDGDAVYGLIYAGMVIAQGVMVLNHLNQK